MCLHGPRVLREDELGAPLLRRAAELLHGVLHPVRGVRAHVAIRPAGGGRLEEPFPADVAQARTEIPPHGVEVAKDVRFRLRHPRLDLGQMLEEMAVGLARDEADRHEVDVLVGRQLLDILHELGVRRVKPLRDLGCGMRRGRRSLALVLGLGVAQGAALAAKPVRQRLVQDLEPVREMREHRLRRPSG